MPHSATLRNLAFGARHDEHVTGAYGNGGFTHPLDGRLVHEHHAHFSVGVHVERLQHERRESLHAADVVHLITICRYMEPIEVLAACLADLAEPNDFVFDAPLAADFSGVPLSICPGDQDWFEMRVVGNRAVSVQIAFSHAAADLDLYMFDEDGVLVASSDTLADVESINYLPSAGGTRFVQVVAFDSSAAGSYVMTVE
jgi:hypothetical protein